MVKFRSWTGHGCVPTQLLLCLLIGLRLVSSSVQGATSNLRLRFTPSSQQQQETHEQHHIAPRTPKWTEAVFCDPEAQPRLQRRNGTLSTYSTSDKTDQQEAPGLRRSLSDKDDDCQPGTHREHKGGACVGQPAKDYIEDHVTDTATPSGNTIKEQAYGAYEGSSLTSSAPDSGSSSDNDSNSNSPDFGPSSSISNNSNNTSLATSASSNQDSTESSNLPSSTSQSPPPPPPNRTPSNFNFGGNLNNGSRTESRNDNSAVNNSNSTLSDGNVNSQTNHPSSSNNKTKAIAVGVTVPVGVLALGLIALVILHKQRQRQRRAEQGQTLSGGKDEEMTDTPATGINTPRISVREVVPIAALGEASNDGHTDPTAEHGAAAGEHGAAAGEQDEAAEAGTEVSSAPSHITELTHPATPMLAGTEIVTPATESKPTPGSEASPQTGTSTPSSQAGGSPGMRGRSLKRKPVPALLETFDPTKLDPSSSSRAEACSAPHSPLAAVVDEAACIAGQSPVNQSLTSLQS
ncbi:hypothetical protein NDA14_007554 [Ustilago hordei]|uniref:Uncharacterized protein n=1 Tax=Ustilago hordei TaxID=120017 RepID=I2G1E2_USTHO|nr:uncharacterized protein UHO2_03419 [Ustilago hordei]KAJ1580972.1 hypothetical protein NDA15_001768 [Ustilago hordei]KAJ1582664.1 hypothetical protein NDA12_000436 [Ustilago hordei]KAJ1600041.1 hypothetical protein NDA14_007554 [Ustilago hordei]UTT92279.1 hypothetical protein NDA17_002029 [Ustilago hordei]CCF52985.1 uncharacterized protein UHOR_04373 [Ustilago hordei]